MVWVIAFVSPDSFVFSSKSLCEKIHPTYQTFGTMTNPAAGTKSIGLPADALLSWFLHRHLDSFIVTGQLAAIYRDSVIWTTLS